MRNAPNVASIAALMGDPTRAAMLAVLMDGRALPANELGYAAGGISAQAASGHLAKLVAGGLLAVEREGRHRYFRLTDSQVAEALEALASLLPPLTAVQRLSPEAMRLRYARRCYDHLAGELGVAVMTSLTHREFVKIEESKRVIVTAAGQDWFAALGIDSDALPRGRHGIARVCLDWTERCHHLAGPLGKTLLMRMIELGWLRREQESRIIIVTDKGRRKFESRFGILLVNGKKA